jgi:hypothetical protein
MAGLKIGSEQFARSNNLLAPVDDYDDDVYLNIIANYESQKPTHEKYIPSTNI